MSFANPRIQTLPPDVGVLVFVKSPVPGACKTRLAAGLGDRRAALIYRAMAERTVTYAHHAAPGRVWLLCSPDTRHASFLRMARRYGLRRRRQAGGDLGRRMHRALRDALAVHSRVVLIGSDQPDLAGHPLSDAAAHLGPSCQAWLAPTSDGGYWGIGLTRPAAALFRGPVWSTPRVAQHTRTLLQNAGFNWREYPIIRRDIDQLRDWRQLPAALRRNLAADALRPACCSR